TNTVGIVVEGAYVTEPVAPLKLVTPVLLNTFPVSARPVPIEVVPSLPEESKNASVLVAKLYMVELLNVAVEFAVSPPLNVCAPVQVTELAAVTNPGLIKLRA